MKETLGLGIIVLWLAVIGGWIANIYKFAVLIFQSAPIDTLFIGRGVGILFAPLGAILGYF